ncbi:amidohydrolase family protein [Streptomyces sp. SID8379]|uniref:amidohydrolase n=1 Tax=unclassified Streptomyces TaxID=2593676 RepID=UPI00038069DF|nr:MULTISPECIES: amidohydrolase [unclassified Streptomyces]MYW66426.1 amidohydrolase family protein [Streptomyces sp. SID8379]
MAAPTAPASPASASLPPADLIVTGCTALLHADPDELDPQRAAEGIEFRPDTAIVVRDGIIADVTDSAAASRMESVERIDAHGLVALPGLVNCHTHSPMVALRGLVEDRPEQEWFNDWIWPIESNLTPRVVALGARLACAEMIRGGVTCFADHYFAMDVIADVVTETGLRANLGEAFFSSQEAGQEASQGASQGASEGVAQGSEGLARSLDFALTHRGRADGRITTSLAPHAPYTVTAEDLAATAQVAREHDLLVHLHAAENRAQTDTSLARHGRTPIDVLHDTGLLDVDVLIAHGTGILERDLPALRAARGRTGIATAPRGYMKFGWDTTPVRALVDAGVHVGLATDGAASNNTLDVWEAMTLTALVQKQTEHDPRWLTARQALRHATLDSARAVGLGDTVGSLAPGRRADLVLVDLNGPHTQPVHDLAATLVHSARSADVRTTIVDGRVLMRDGRLTTVDVPSVTGELSQLLPALVERGHGKRIQEYDT